MRKPLFIVPRKSRVPAPWHKRLLAAGKALAAIGVLVLCFPVVKEQTPRAVAVALIVAGAILTIVDAFVDFRRKRPRRRMLELAAITGGMTLAFVLVSLAIYSEGEPDWWMGMFFSAGAAAICVWCFLRWRRLKSDAAVRLATLKMNRRKQFSKNRL